MMSREDRLSQAARLRLLAELTERIGREVKTVDGPMAGELSRVGHALGAATTDLQVIATRLDRRKGPAR